MYFIYSIDCILMDEKFIMLKCLMTGGNSSRILRTDLFTGTSNWELNVPLMRKDQH